MLEAGDEQHTKGHIGAQLILIFCPFLPIIKNARNETVTGAVKHGKAHQAIDFRFETVPPQLLEQLDRLPSFIRESTQVFLRFSTFHSLR